MFKFESKATRRAAVLLTLAFGSLPALMLPADHEEGGYAGTDNEGHDTVVYNFLKHFNYNQYYYASEHQWTWNNDARVDDMDFAIFAGHGSRWSIQMEDGTSVDLSEAGDSSDLGFGDDDCEFVAFESCKVVPSPIDVADWSSKWTGPDGIFDGLHQAVGFRTDSYQSTDQRITDYFGDRVHDNYGIWESWFDAIDRKGRSDEFGSAVMYPPSDGDTYQSFSADPPANHSWLRVWYQH